jgi:hypothetical protein
MRLSTTSYLFALIGIFAVSTSLHAAPLVDRWTFAGGGLDPATYGGNFRPTPINPDAALSNGATIVASNLVVTPFGSGGLGSTGLGAYGGIYTFFASSASFALSTSNILSSLDEITITLVAGGGNPTPLSYTGSSLTLNYNGSNTAVASTGFASLLLPDPVTTPVGDLQLTRYTWTWTDLSALGESTQFSTSWNVQGQQHAFFEQISLTQAIPEPSTVALIAIGGAFCVMRRRRR